MARHKTSFKPAWWLTNPHAQTIWGSLCRPWPRPRYRRQRLELPDGDFLDLDWSPGSHHANAPLVLVLHGLEGCSRSAYARGLVEHLDDVGFDTVVMNFRGCGGMHNRLRRTYHSGETSDFRHVVRWLRRHWPERALFAVGFSLGGNVLLKYLGESCERSRLSAAVAICVPMRLEVCADRMERGLSRLYLRRLVGLLKKKLLAKYRKRPAALDLARVARSRGFREFDDAATAPLHGFQDAAAYYAASSAAPYVSRIETPTLIVHASDDPFMSDAVLPDPDRIAPAVRLEVSPRGGHTGFIAGAGPLGLVPRYWLDHRVSQFLREGARRG